MDDARRAAERLQADSAQLIGNAQENFDDSTRQLEIAFGVGEERGIAWQGYENLILQNMAQKGAFDAQVGASGLKNTGSIEMMGNQITGSAAKNEEAMRRGIVGNLEGGISKVSQGWDDAEYTYNQMQSDAAYLATEWAGFDWNNFVSGAVDPQAEAASMLGGWERPGGAFTLNPTGVTQPRGPQVNRVGGPGGGPAREQSATQRLYGARGAARDAGWRAIETKYNNAIEDQENDFWSIGADFLTGAKFGLDIAGKVTGLG
jgi:hypothetical protein